MNPLFPLFAMCDRDFEDDEAIFFLFLSSRKKCVDSTPIPICNRLLVCSAMIFGTNVLPVTVSHSFYHIIIIMDYQPIFSGCVAWCFMVDPLLDGEV